MTLIEILCSAVVFSENVRKLDSAQIRAIRVIRLQKAIPYSESLRKLNLFSY